MSKKNFVLFILPLVLLVGLSTSHARHHRGIVGKKAPPWQVDEWVSLPDGKRQLDISDYKGKVVYLFFFQSWCPGCHSRGFPTLKAVQEHFKNQKDVVFVAMQTVFEGYTVNNSLAGRASLLRHGLDVPLAQSGGDEQKSSLMGAYRSGGTPWTVLIDKEGVVRFNGFNIKKEKAIAMVDTLRRAPPKTLKTK